MRIGLLLLTCGLSMLAFAAVVGGLAWWNLWLAAAFAHVGAASLFARPRALGKRPDGSLAWPAVLLLLPFFLLTWALWHVQRAVSRERCWDRVGPGLLLGRRPLAGELPRELTHLVDLTAEFPAARGVARRAVYRCVPLLDACAAPDDVLLALVADLRELPGPIYVHCAQGHGRSAMVVIALLLARGAASVEQAEAAVIAARPGVRLHAEQRAALIRLAPRLRR